MTSLELFDDVDSDTDTPLLMFSMYSSKSKEEFFLTLEISSTWQEFDIGNRLLLALQAKEQLDLYISVLQEEFKGESTTFH